MKVVQFSLIPLILFSCRLTAQNYAEQLGYPTDAKLLIIHADDLGMAHSKNVASIDALENGSVSSASVMVPCPWIMEVAEYARANEGRHDLGIHLTVTCEWKNLKWGPVASLGKVESLVDSLGYFHSDCTAFADGLKLEELRTELRAQILKAKAMGIHPTHLDSHMGCLFFQNREIFQIYLDLGREFDIPVFVARDMFALDPSLKEGLEDQILIDKVFSPGPADYAAGMAQYYEQVLEELPPGLNMIIIHAALDNAEMQAVAVDHPDWGSAWRQADYDFFVSDRCKQLIEEEGIQLVSWRQVGKLLKD
jgi:predicted glycoside hydrolase/deacetylase ChbG (UPF0249 family)